MSNHPGTLTAEEVEALILEHRGWAESIARSVARSWNMDWQLDGLDGAAMEALIFCARRFDPARGVPFKGYARKRIHEASTEEARKSRGWKLGIHTKGGKQTREVSARLFDVFPQLREGQLPIYDDAGGEDSGLRSAVRNMLVGASVIAASLSAEESSMDQILEYKKVVTVMAEFERVHQLLMWKTYWEGQSMRQLAAEWETDELNVMREHKVLVNYLFKAVSGAKQLKKPGVRPGLKPVALKIDQNGEAAPFRKIIDRANAG